MTKTFPFFLFFFLLSSCSKKSVVYKKSLNELKTVNLFIQLPKNKGVFEDVSGIIYKQVYDHFQSVGFSLVDRKKSDFILKIEIKNLQQNRKVISPDVLSYGFHIKFDLICKLFNNSKLLKEKSFSFIRFIANPSYPVLTSSFLSFEYRKLMKTAAVKIDHYFRYYFLNMNQK